MDISEQQLMDCSWGFGNSGCRGGYSWRALVWAKKHGVASSHSYGRYLAQVCCCQGLLLSGQQNPNMTTDNFDHPEPS